MSVLQKKARLVRTVISSLTGVLGTIRLCSHPNSKVSLTGAERTMRLSVLPSGSFTAQQRRLISCFPYFLSLLPPRTFFPYEGAGKKA